ncbi:helix-turn-helix transcriptional regulator [Kitasatospora fiedleri]|uniref:helix-turn-helix transcriptional regulator n=1 Tax=Kitasatospora fiedleri TaxID=2991545 RepID=UPI00249A337B|nr:helix-turn-helix transcriptional regulator [Kitasatospora fiedleri]
MGKSAEPELDWAHLGEEIRRARLARGLSQQQLANALGLDRKTIGHYENGRVPAPGRIPDGYYAAATFFGWSAGTLARVLAGGEVITPTQTAPASQPAAPFHGGSPAELFPAVGRFARAAVAAGGDPRLRDLLEDVADRLLQSVPARTEPSPAHQSSYGLAAYRPHAWAEGDPGIPEDDAERIRQALDEHARGKGE